MQIKIPLLTAIIVLTTVIAIPLATHTVAATPGKSVDDPANVWYPYGPAPVLTGGAQGVTKLVLSYYAAPESEFADFIAGKIDVTDWEQPKASFASYDLNPDFQLSPIQGQFGDFGIYFNGLDTTWAAWGCDWTLAGAYTDSLGATHPFQTYQSACGINMRQAFAHLVDRPAFVRDDLGGTSAALADPSPPAKDPSASSLATQCSWDTMFPTCISAYNIRDDPGGFAQPGTPDFCAAADHMIAAGIATGKTAGTCVLTGVNAGVFANHMKGMVRNNDSRRFDLGNGFDSALNQLFGATVVDPTFGGIGVLGGIVFTDPPESPVNDWSFYTFGYGLGGPFPDHLFDLYYSGDASDLCGGPNNPEPDNPTFVCMKNFDNDVILASSTADVPTFKSATLAAFNEYGKAAADLATFSAGVRTAALTSVAGLTNSRGLGYYNGYTINYAHKDASYTPANANYAFGGGHDDTLRWGQAQDTKQLNIFHASTVWEFQLIGEIYDTIFSASPVQIASVYGNMCVTNANFPCTTPDTTSNPGNTVFHVQLRQNLRWQDGVQVDAKDIAFSLLSLRDFAPTAGGALHFLKSVRVFSSTQLDVTFSGQSISFPIDMEAFVIPRHVWECTTDNTCAASVGANHADYVAAGVSEPSITKRSTSFDPVANGALIGSGQWVCASVFGTDSGKVGTGCTRNADGSRGGQAIPVGGTALLAAYDFTGNAGNTDPFLQYMRSYNANWGSGSGTAAQSGQYQEWSWADQNNDGQVTIADAVAVGACWHATGPNTNCNAAAYNYWLKSSLHSGSPAEISTETAVVQSHIDEGWLLPFAWSNTALENVVPFSP